MRPIVLLAVTVLVLSAFTLLPAVTLPSHAVTTAFSFAASGDHRSLTATNGLASLDRLQTVGADFYVSLGDMSYDPSVTGDIWCGQFKAKFNNIQIIPGDHDTGGHNSAAFGETHSYEKYVNGCPLTLGVPLVCGPVAGNCYGKEYYFDYPSTSPIARFIFASPKIYNITGVCTQALEPAGNWPGCSSQTGQPCTDQYGCWPYAQGDIHYNWVSTAIDNARASGIKWVIVGTHKLCISASDATCSMGIAFFNMLISKKVDLLIQAHDDAYERGKQIALNSSTCPSFATDGNGYTLYNSNCVVDNGSRGYYTSGTGTVVTVQGAWSDNLYNVNDTSINGGANAKEAPYFAELMGANTPGAEHGFLKYNVTLDRISVQTYFSSTFQDGFSIISPTSLNLAASFTYTPSSPTAGQTVTFTATASGGVSPYTFSWNFGDGATATGNPTTHSYSAGTYTVKLTVQDSASATVSVSQNVRVSQPDFTISANPSSLPVTIGSSSTSTITLTSLNSFAGSVSLSASGSPSGLNVSLNPTSVSLLRGALPRLHSRLPPRPTLLQAPTLSQ